MTRSVRIRDEHTIDVLGITDIEREIGKIMIIDEHVSTNVCPSKSKTNT